MVSDKKMPVSQMQFLSPRAFLLQIDIKFSKKRRCSIQQKGIQAAKMYLMGYIPQSLGDTLHH
jgi:hypothetical protein